MDKQKEMWALRSGDLKPERVETLGFGLPFCRKLEAEGLVFPTKELAEEARAMALSSLRP